MEAQAHHGLAQVRDRKQAQAEPVRLPRAHTCAPQGLELRHLRYFAAVAEAGTFTRAAERLFIAQPTLSQQSGRLEQLVGTPLLHRGRDGVRLTGIAVTWMDTPLDAEFSPIREHRADAGLGWLTASPDTLPAPLDAMTLGQFEPDVWIPRSHPDALGANGGGQRLRRLTGRAGLCPRTWPLHRALYLPRRMSHRLLAGDAASRLDGGLLYIFVIH
jgi:regulatory helix-turn-helix LysR family protein